MQSPSSIRLEAGIVTLAPPSRPGQGAPPKSLRGAMLASPAGLAPSAEPSATHCPAIHTSPLVLVTSTSASAYANAERHKSLWDKPSPAPLWLFHEDSWARMHSQPTRASIGLPVAAACFTDIFEAEPWLFGAVGRGGPIDNFYAFAGDMEPCDQPLAIKSGKLLVRKVASMHHAVRALRNGTLVVWLDIDVTFNQAPDEDFARFASQYDVSFIPITTNKVKGVPIRTYQVNFKGLDSPYWRLESGVVAFRVGAGALKLLSRAIDLYTGGLLRLARRCLSGRHAAEPPCTAPWLRRNVYLDDIFLFSLVLHEAHYAALGRPGELTD